MSTANQAELLREHLHVVVPEEILSAASGHVTRDHVFDEPILAEDVLDEGSAMVWGGQMLPDSVPVADTGCGDVILLRFREDGSLREPVAWYHEGGLWHPLALGTVHPCPVDDLMRETEAALRSMFHDHCIKGRGGRALAERLGVPWPEMSRWLTDTARIPAAQRTSLAGMAAADDIDGFFFQDWERARKLAAECHELQPELAWPDTVLGWIAERNGDWREAVTRYTRALTGFATTVAFTDGWSHDGNGTFAAVHLRHCLLVTGETCPARVDPMIAEPDPFGAVRDFWMDRGREFLAAGDGPSAYHSFYRAGWDWFFTNDMAVVLEHLVQAAELSGSKALTALARLHLSHL